MALNAAIGQGEMNVTPLQQAVTYAAIANGGDVWKPQVVRRIEAPDGKMVQEFRREVARKLGLKETPAGGAPGLEAVVNEPCGTAYRSRLPDIELRGQDRHRAGGEARAKQKLDDARRRTSRATTPGSPPSRRRTIRRSWWWC